MVSKLSGLGTFIHRNDPGHIAEVVEETAALFGAERCLFGSNFPIEKLWTDYAALIAAYRDAIAGYHAGGTGGDAPRHRGAGVPAVGRRIDGRRPSRRISANAQSGGIRFAIPPYITGSPGHKPHPCPSTGCGR